MPTNNRYRAVTLNLPQSLAEEIEKTRQEALSVSLGLGEEDNQQFYELLLRVGNGDVQKWVNESRLVAVPTVSLK